MANLSSVDAAFAVMFKSTNITARIFEREIRTPAPGTSVNCARRFYENIVPSYTIADVECPDHSFRKFTDDGRYLVSFSRNHQDLIIYRPKWLNYSCKEEDCDTDDLPSKAKKFESFFTQLYSVSLASANELICKDFLYMERNQFGLFATSTTQIHDAPATGGAVQGVPFIEKITFHLLSPLTVLCTSHTNFRVIRLEDGVVLDEKVFRNDFINLDRSMGVFLYDDLLAILSLRFQTVHVLQIRDSGDLVVVREIGEYCREDDEFFLNSTSQFTSFSDTGRLQNPPVNNVENHHQDNESTSGHLFLNGIKQRLLSFIFQEIWDDEPDEVARVQCLKTKFYFHFQDYVDLIIWKVQFLDRQHLLIKFGSVEGGVSRNSDNHPAFFAIYNMETTEIVAFYQNSSEELYLLFERYCDYFHATSRNGSEAENVDARTKKVSSFLFHPFLPLALSVQQTLFLQPSVVNIHFRR
ncbi:unnamed protein product [Rhodiola kirilowii]